MFPNVLKIPVRRKVNVNDFGCGFNSEKLLYPKISMTTFVVEATNLKTLHECRGSGAMTIIFDMGEKKTEHK